ncbi:hypothetical protein R3P38DRAFT_2762996 [Favolaschia claudopus]|uniref:MULE transposase domain-containing protein n=1 Tax=Favolaschia claudopus TaxID=2862362 RepID=A0AAW0DP70_9AGAR
MHEKYVCIDVPEDVKQFIDANSKLRSYQLWKEILKTHPLPAFSQKAVYNLWLKHQLSQWRRSDNELDSAKILLAEFARNPKYQVESIPLPADSGDGPGTIREVALDSTFNTTKAGYECFALLGEVFGSGLPVGFLFIKTSNPDPNQKEKYIRAFIRNLLGNWNLDVIQSLSDKDITEINALLAELPEDVKHLIPAYSRRAKRSSESATPGQSREPHESGHWPGVTQRGSESRALRRYPGHRRREEQRMEEKKM